MSRVAEFSALINHPVDQPRTQPACDDQRSETDYVLLCRAYVIWQQRSGLGYSKIMSKLGIF